MGTALLRDLSHQSVAETARGYFSRVVRRERHGRNVKQFFDLRDRAQHGHLPGLVVFGLFPAIFAHREAERHAVRIPALDFLVELSPDGGAVEAGADLQAVVIGADLEGAVPLPGEDAALVGRKGLLQQLDDKGVTLEGGIQVEEAVMLPEYMKSDEEKAKFQGAKLGDVITINPAKAYADNATELASLLHISKEAAAEMKADFNFQISEITRFVPAKLSQELYDQMLGKDVVKSEEEFRKFIADDIKKNFNSEAEYQFTQDLRSYVINRIGEVEFPEALLKRFMKLRNADKGEEYVENNFKDSLPELLWHLAKEQICDQLEVKVQHEDVLETAKAYTRIQFAQYGMINLPEESITNYAAEMLKNEQQAQGLVERTVENMMAAKVKEVVTLKVKEVTIDEFRKLTEKK